MKNLVMRQSLLVNKLAIFLPESFEWIILKSGLVNDTEWEAVKIPEKYVDSAKHSSWERYFTDLLIELTKNKQYEKYSKHKLSDFYLHDKSVEMIKDVMPGLDL